MKKIVLGVSAVALALVLGVSVVSAQTAVTTTTTTSTTFTRDLTIGSTGADVTALQAMLIAGGKLMIATPTGYFGTLTKTALAAWQASVGITPASGYFGPITKAYIASHTMTSTSSVPGCMAGDTFSRTTGKSCTSVTSTTSDNNKDDDKDDNKSSSSDLKGGEASLEDLNGKDGDDDDVSEGEKGNVAEFEFDVEDADIEIQRLDLSFRSDATGDEESEPWDTFKKITIMDDKGKKLASEDVSKEDDWLENDDEPYVFRFNNLDYKVKEGKTGKLKVQVEAQDGIDGLTSSNDIAWTVFIDDDGLRGTDGEDIEQYLPSNAASEDEVTFDVSEKGSDDDLSVRANSDDPDATTFKVEDDGSSDWYTVFAFDLDSDDDSGDIKIDHLPITFTTSDRVGDVINDLKLKIDGKEFDDYGSFSSSTASTASTTFDIDKDYTVKGGHRVKVEVMAEFKTGSTTSTYPDGTTIQASVDGSQIDAEGEDDITVDGTATGDTHTLRVMGVDVTAKSVSNSDQAPDVDGADNDVATFFVNAEVKAFDQDVFISQSGPVAFDYVIEDETGATIAVGSTTTASPTISSSADTQGNYYRVNENDSETFKLQVSFNPSPAAEGHSYRLQITAIHFAQTATTPNQTYNATPASDFQTDYKYIAD